MDKIKHIIRNRLSENISDEDLDILVEKFIKKLAIDIKNGVYYTFNMLALNQCDEFLDDIIYDLCELFGIN